MILNFNKIILSRNLKFGGSTILLVFLMFTSLYTQAQSLETYIEEATKGNPAIRAAETQHAISIEKIAEAKTLPDTEFSAGYMFGKNQMPMMQQGEFGVMQMLPWFGTNAARSNYATAMADAVLPEIEIAKRKIAMDLSQSYYRLYEISKKQEVLNSNIELLKIYEQLALTSVEVAEASVVSVLRLQMRQNELVEKRLMLQQDYSDELIVFNMIMNRKEFSDISIPDTLLMPFKDSEADFTDLNFHPELLKYEELGKTVTQAEALNKKERAPDLGVGMEYMLYHETPNMFMPMASVSIPIFNKK